MQAACGWLGHGEAAVAYGHADCLLSVIDLLVP
jgi:hypothetical protein